MSNNSIYYHQPELVAAGSTGTWLALEGCKDLHEEWETAHERAIKKGKVLYLIIAMPSNTVVVHVDKESEVGEHANFLADQLWHRFVLLSRWSHQRAVTASAENRQRIETRAHSLVSV